MLRQSRFGEVRVFVDTGDRGPAMRDVVGAPGGDLSDLLGDVVPRVDESAALLDGLEALPSLVRQLVGEVLDEPRPAGGIQDPADVRLLEQQQLDVAGHPAGETGRHAGESALDRDVEREYQHGVGAADAGAERGQRRPQHVHPGIALGHHRQRRLGMHDGRAAVRLTEDLGDPRPQPTQRPDLGDGQELVVVGGQPEADLRSAFATDRPDSVSTRR